VQSTARSFKSEIESLERQVNDWAIKYKGLQDKINSPTFSNLMQKNLVDGVNLDA